MTLNINSDFVREDKERIKTNQKTEENRGLFVVNLVNYKDFFNVKWLADRTQGYKLK